MENHRVTQTMGNLPRPYIEVATAETLEVPHEGTSVHNQKPKILSNPGFRGHCTIQLSRIQGMLARQCNTYE